MLSLARIPLEGGGAVLVEAAPDAMAQPLQEGTVKAGRMGDAIRELPVSLEAALAPVRDAARVMLEQLRQAGPDAVEVEFGVHLATQAGAVIASSEASCNLKVRLLWDNGDRAWDTV